MKPDGLFADKVQKVTTTFRQSVHRIRDSRHQAGLSRGEISELIDISLLLRMHQQDRLPGGD